MRRSTRLAVGTATGLAGVALGSVARGVDGLTPPAGAAAAISS